VLKEPAPRYPLDSQRLIPLLQANAKGLAALDPPVKHPLSLLSHLTSLPTPPPFTLPDGTVIEPPQLTGELGRKLVIFGDCSGGTPNKAFEALCCNASLLIHECTNAAIPDSVLKGDKGRAVRASGLEQSLESKRDKEFELAAKERGVIREPWIFHGKHETKEAAVCAVEEFEAKRVTVRDKAVSRGHSTPELVGEFAYAIGARRVVVNHFSAM
jgi:ribonuclease Z